jgi:hypothetical protein
MTLIQDIARPVEFPGPFTIWARLDGLGFYLTLRGERIGTYRRKADARRAARRLAKKNPK